MGYTHYWRIPSAAEWQKTWPQLITDTHLIIEAAGIPLTKTGPFRRTGEFGHPPVINNTIIHLNGEDKDSHEDFVLEPEATIFSHCKTQYKPYDIVVTAILLRASQLAGEAIKVR